MFYVISKNSGYSNHSDFTYGTLLMDKDEPYIVDRSTFVDSHIVGNLMDTSIHANVAYINGSYYWGEDKSGYCIICVFSAYNCTYILQYSRI